MSQILFLLTKDPRPFGERASEAGTVSLLGMLAIFGVLAILWGAIELFHLCISAAGKKKAKKQNQVEQPTPAEVSPTEPEIDDGALVAAITAAIAAARTEEGNTTGFRVVSFRRSH